MDAVLHNAQWLLAAGGEGTAKKEYFFSFPGLLIFTLLVSLVAIAILSSAKREFGNRFFLKWPAQYAEHLYIFAENLAVGIIGAHGRKYVPMVFTFWMMIFISNFLGLLNPKTITADLSFNLALAFIAIGYVQYEGIRANGFFGHLGHFAGPKLPLWLIPVNGLIFVIEIISELIKNLSLSIRLFGNIDGGSKATEGMNALNSAIPVGAVLLPVKVLTCVVQAFIFSLLFCVYLSLVTHHDHDEEHAHNDHPEENPDHPVTGHIPKTPQQAPAQ